MFTEPIDRSSSEMAQKMSLEAIRRELPAVKIYRSSQRGGKASQRALQGTFDNVEKTKK